jgi:hypothetical protein
MLAYTEKFLKRWQNDPLIPRLPPTLHLHLFAEDSQDAAALARKYMRQS